MSGECDVEYIKKNLNRDPIWINKMFREACARFLDATPIASKITVEIEKRGTTIYMKVNDRVLDERGCFDAHEGMPDEGCECRGCGKAYSKLMLRDVSQCTNCGVNVP